MSLWLTCVLGAQGPQVSPGYIEKISPCHGSVSLHANQYWLCGSLYKFPIVARSAAAHLRPECAIAGQRQLPISVWQLLCVLDGAGAQGIKSHKANTDPCDPLKRYCNIGLPTTVFPKLCSLC
uniref:Uncharacterized protein n=1 Tax=Rousettus aegyptiacus TaxID=9407 RepID=A0A7J8C2E8_ROUAE|nr:hypothetical protein HJG63_009348 [Rousettus aegyptiacus]